MANCKFIKKYKCNARQTLDFIWDSRARVGAFAECMTSQNYGNCKCYVFERFFKGILCFDFVKNCHDKILAPYTLDILASHCIVDGVDTKIRTEQALLSLPKGTILKITRALEPGGVAKASHSFFYLGRGLVTGVNWSLRRVSAWCNKLLSPPSLCCYYKFFFLFANDATLLNWNIPIGTIYYSGGGEYSLYASTRPLENYLKFL